MKIALCLSGQSRRNETIWNQLQKQFVAKFNSDVFIHTWTEWAHDKNRKQWQDQKLDYTKSWIKHKGATNKEKIVEIFNPKKIIVEEQICSYKDKNWLNLLDIQSVSPLTSTSMYYSIMKSHELMREYEKENNINYDITIRCRFDLNIENTNIPFGQCKENEIWIPKKHDAGGLNDRFAFGTPHTMDIYAQTYCKIFDVYEWCKERQDKIYASITDPKVKYYERQFKYDWEKYKVNFGIHPEMILMYQLEENGIKVIRYNQPCRIVQ